MKSKYEKFSLQTPIHADTSLWESSMLEDLTGLGMLTATPSLSTMEPTMLDLDVPISMSQYKKVKFRHLQKSDQVTRVIQPETSALLKLTPMSPSESSDIKVAVSSGKNMMKDSLSLLTQPGDHTPALPGAIQPTVSSNLQPAPSGSQLLVLPVLPETSTPAQTGVSALAHIPLVKIFESIPAASPVVHLQAHPCVSLQARFKFSSLAKPIFSPRTICR